MEVASRTRDEMIALVHETVEAFTGKPRAFTEGLMTKCVYFGPEACCAIGRKMLPSLKETLTKRGLNTRPIWIVMQELGMSLDELLIPEARGYPKWLWDRLQSLHDEHRYWYGQELSTEGKMAVSNILTILGASG